MIFLRCDQLFHIFILFVSVSPVLPGAGNGDVISTLIEAAEPPVGFSGAPIWNDVKLSHVGYWGYYRFTTFFFDGTPSMDVDEMYYQASATDWRLKPANQQLNNLFRANAH